MEDRPGPGALPHRTPVPTSLNLCLSRGIYTSQSPPPESRAHIARISAPAAILLCRRPVHQRLRHQPARAAYRARARRSSDLPLLPRLLGRAPVRLLQLAAADGRQNYSSTVGDSVYYGNCLPGKTSALDGGGCELPLQVTTLTYTRHANASLGAQRNTILRGVPAVIYNGGDSVELYSGRVAIEVFSDDLSEALHAIRKLRPINAPGSDAGALPPPVYCPGPLRAAPGCRAGSAADLPRACLPEGGRHAEDRSGPVRQRLRRAGRPRAQWLADLPAQAEKCHRPDQRRYPQRDRAVGDDRRQHR